MQPISRSKKTEIINAALIFLFMYAAGSKLFNFNAFRTSLYQSPLLMQWALILAWLLPSMEIATAVLLLFKRSRPTGLYLSLFLMVAFTIYISFILLKGGHLPCSCGGVIKKLSWGQHFWFNLFFIILTLIGIRYSKSCRYKKEIIAQ
jgi:hypothetical protein